MKHFSLKKKILSLVTLTFFLIGMIVVVAAFGYSHFKAAAIEQSLQEELSSSIDAQANSLLISLMLIEQQDGLNILLQQYAKAEQLTRSLLIKDGNPPANFSRCQFNENLTHCLNDSGNEVAMIVPIKTQNKIYGHYFKAKGLQTNRWNTEALRWIVSIIGVLFLAFIILFLGIAKITSRDIPRAFQQLNAWIEKSLAAEQVPIGPVFGLTEFDELAQEIGSIISRNQETQRENQALQQQSAIAKVAAQVAHDIRSPLAALGVAVTQISEISEEGRVLIRGAVQRIQDIANDLAGRHKSDLVQPSDHGQKSVQLISSIISSIVSEKRLQYRSHLDLRIEEVDDPASYGLFAEIDPVEFKRAISNLINNAAEALSGQKGHIQISVRRQDAAIVITIADNGKGIPSDLLPKLMQRGASFGKTGGSGLGLFHAKSCFESWGGSVSISSEVGKGTAMGLALPIHKSPLWFVPEIAIMEEEHIVIIDDDNSIHQVWKSRFEELGPAKVHLHHFSSPDAFTEWQNSDGAKINTTYILCDYEFVGNSQNGLDVIHQSQKQGSAILVTSHFEESDIQKKCIKYGIRLLPKNLAGSVPIRIAEPKSELDAVLIDDDELVRMNWNIRAKLKNKAIKVFSNPHDFLRERFDYPRQVTIYIDSDLSCDLPGEAFAQKLYQEGFTNIFLATGYDPKKFENLTCLQGVVGKSPPW